MSTELVVQVFTDQGVCLQVYSEQGVWSRFLQFVHPYPQHRVKAEFQYSFL